MAQLGSCLGSVRALEGQRAAREKQAEAGIVRREEQSEYNVFDLGQSFSSSSLILREHLVKILSFRRQLLPNIFEFMCKVC